jgi:sulfur carrier protein ThiS
MAKKRAARRAARPARSPDAGYISVRVGQLPGRIEEIALNGDRNVAAALEAAGLSKDGYQVKVNGEDATVDQGVEQGDTILLVRKVAGAC